MGKMVASAPPPPHGGIVEPSARWMPPPPFAGSQEAFGNGWGFVVVICVAALLITAIIELVPR